jgi:autotransporter-associated beta strand protein
MGISQEKKYFFTTLVCLSLGMASLNAATVPVSTEAELDNAINGTTTVNGDTIQLTANITLTANAPALARTPITIDGGSGPFSINGGGFNLINVPANLLTLNSNLAITNTSNIQWTLGTLTINADQNIAGDGPIIISDTMSIDVNYTPATIANNITLNGTQLAVTPTTVGNASVALSGIISGSGARLAFLTTGDTYTISGNNTWSGGTDLARGTIILTHSNGLGTGTLQIESSAVLQLGTGISPANNILLFDAGTKSFDVASSTSTLSGVISGPGSFGKTGAGTLILSNTNTYTGTTSVSGGTLAISTDANIGAGTTALTLNSGTTLQANGASSLSSHPITLNGSSTIDTNGSTFSISTVISGTGPLTKISAGTLTLSGANTYSNGTTISAGTLQAGAANTIPSTGLVTVSGGATFNLNSFNQTIGNLTGSGNATLGTAALTVGDSTTQTFSGIITGVGGSITKQGIGTLILSGANTYTGGTTVSAGVLQGDTTSLQGNILDNASVVFDQSTTGTYAGILSGSGSVTKQNTGTLILTGANTYSGGTTVSAGVLQGTTTSLQGNILDNASVVFDQTTTGTYAGIMSGSGSLTKQNTGTVILTGANTYSGGTTVSAGVLQGTTTSLQGNILDNASVVFDQTTTGTYAGIMSGSGSLTKQNTGTVILTGANTYSGGTTVSAGVLQGTTTSLQGNILDNASVVFDQTTTGTYARHPQWYRLFNQTKHRYRHLNRYKYLQRRHDCLRRSSSR